MISEENRHSISDDPSRVDQILHDLKASYAKGLTRPATFRKEALNSLIKGY